MISLCGLLLLNIFISKVNALEFLCKASHMVHQSILSSSLLSSSLLSSPVSSVSFFLSLSLARSLARSRSRSRGSLFSFAFFAFVAFFLIYLIYFYLFLFFNFLFFIYLLIFYFIIIIIIILVLKSKSSWSPDFSFCRREKSGTKSFIIYSTEYSTPSIEEVRFCTSFFTLWVLKSSSWNPGFSYYH